MNDGLTPGTPSLGRKDPGSTSQGKFSHDREFFSATLDEILQQRDLQAGGSLLDSAWSHARVRRASAGACPEPGEWALFLNDQPLSAQPRAADFAKVSALLAHASACRVCAQRLRTLSSETAREEATVAGLLGSASPDVHRKVAGERARTPQQGSPIRVTGLYLWIGFGLAALLLISFGLVFWWRVANNPERLLTEAYEHDRIFDLRMPGARFAEVTPRRHTRARTTARESRRLLDALAGIQTRLEAAPEDEHWLELEARADILEEKFDPAIDILDRLLAAAPASAQTTAGLLLDDASAYFQRGAATGSESDRAAALDYLRRADGLAPADTVVLFNEALAMEDRGQLMNAVETWNRYLRFERNSRWQTEGRRRLAALEQRLNELKTHQSRLDQPRSAASG